MARRKFTRDQLAERKMEYPVFSCAIAHKRETPVDPQVLAAISPVYDPLQTSDPDRIDEWAYFIREYRNLNLRRKLKMKKRGYHAVAVQVLYEVGSFNVNELARLFGCTATNIRFLIGYARERKWARKHTIKNRVDDELS